MQRFQNYKLVNLLKRFGHIHKQEFEIPKQNYCGMNCYNKRTIYLYDKNFKSVILDYDTKEEKTSFTFSIDYDDDHSIKLEKNILSFIVFQYHNNKFYEINMLLNDEELDYVITNTDINKK